MNEIQEGDEFILLSYKEIAVMLTISLKVAREIVASGEIPLVKVSERVHRVRLSDVKAFISRGGARSNV